MKLDATHPTVLALSEILPDAEISGGSFAHWLPHPTEITAEDRPRVFKSAYDAAVDECLRGLIQSAGLPEDTTVANGPDGQRLWPRGFVGSVTHKGTIVLGAIAPRSFLESLGIDLERRGGRHVAGMAGFIAPEGVPPGNDADFETLLVFSAKEAVFKAFFALRQMRLEFRDVRLRWRSRDLDCLEASAKCPGVRSFVVRCRCLDGWIVSAAVPEPSDRKRPGAC